MGLNQDSTRASIPVECIHETVMPPYEYQKPQNGFGIISSDKSVNLDQNFTGPKTKAKQTSKS